MKRLWILILLLGISYSSIAQLDTDSIYRKLETASDTKKVTLLNELSESLKTDSANRFIEVNLQIASLAVSLEDYHTANRALNKVALKFLDQS